MKKILLALMLCLVSILWMGCNKIPNKPIYEELTINELAKAIAKDSSFEFFYDYILNDRDIQNMSATQKARYKDITYKRAFKYSKYENEIRWDNKLDSLWNIEWENVYAEDINRADSLIQEMENEKEEIFAEVNSLASFEIVEVSNIAGTIWRRVKDYEWGGYKDVEIKGICSVLKIKTHTQYSKIDEVTMQLYCWGKNGYPRVQDFSFYNEKNLKKDAIWEVTFNGQPEPFEKHTSDFLDKFDYEFRINFITINGKTYKPNFPWSKEFVIAKYKVPKYGSDWIDFVNKNINPDVIDQWEYHHNKVNELLKKYDSLMFEFEEEF